MLEYILICFIYGILFVHVVKPVHVEPGMIWCCLPLLSPVWKHARVYGASRVPAKSGTRYKGRTAKVCPNC